MFIKNKASFPIYILLFISSLIPFFLPEKETKVKVAIGTELYDPELDSVNSVEKALEFIDRSVVQTQKSGSFDTLRYTAAVSHFTKEKFYHGLSRYNYSDNWIACIASDILWDHLSAIVDPEDILKHPDGLCSQQTIVFMELLKRRGIKNRSVGLGYKEGPGHFLTEVFYKGEWHVYDVNKEPKWRRIVNHHKSMDYYMANKDTLYRVYEGQIEKKDFYKIMEKVEYGKPNEFPAKNMKIFHKVTRICTYCLPVIFALLAYLSYRKRKATKEQRIVSPV